MTPPGLSRRAFLERLAAGTAFGLAASLTDGWILSAQTAAAGPWQPNAFCAIDDTGLVNITVHRTEMGQGIRATLAAAVADELGADWSRVRIIQADGDEPRYGSQNTDGSHSVTDFLTPLRQMGATARMMLEAAAAAQWGVPVADVLTGAHEVTHAASGRKLGFGALVAAARALPVPAKERVTLKPLSSLPRLGKKVPFADGVAMTTGRAVYGFDASLPGMKIAVVARPPVYGGTVATVSSAKAEAIPGVEKIVRLPDATLPNGFKPLGGVAVVARNTHAALQGRAALEITWTDGPNASYESTAYRAALEASAKAPGTVIRSNGDVAAALAGAATTISADYYVPHLAHATMEPPAALAHVKDGGCELWAPSQDPQTARKEVATALGIDVARVTLHVTFLGGGFGRKSKPDFIVEAALLAREVGAPVKVIWTRDDEIRHGYYHTVAAQHLEAGLDAAGKPTAWLHRSAFPSIMALFGPDPGAGVGFELQMGASDVPWDVPNLQVESCKAAAHVRVGWYRSVCNIGHAFAIGSFADELAHAAKQDPKAFLDALIGPPRIVDLDAFGLKEWNYGRDKKAFPLDTGRMRHVLDLATTKAGWGRTLPRGHALGVSVHRSFVSYVASVVEVAVAADGRLSVPRVWVAVDCGFAANPDRVRAQMEGAAIMGLGNAIYGEITFKDGRAVQSNFGDYRILPIGLAPREIDVQIVANEQAPGGVGEPGVPPIAPALCNAIFAATGKRLRALPIGERV
jgi:isoquinoline 1-oxidoreductase beta subunit